MTPSGTPRPLRLVLIGPPASGKGTQGRRLSQRLDLPYLGTGALLREHVDKQSELGLLAKPILDRGEYLPDDLMCRMVTGWLDGHSACGWVLDGFPRSIAQAKCLDEHLAQPGRSLTAAISFEAPVEVLRERICGRIECPTCRWSGALAEAVAGGCPECGGCVDARDDDSEENFNSRHQAYVRSALPLVAHYRQRGVLYSCDATAPRDEVTSQLLGMLVPACDQA